MDFCCVASWCCGLLLGLERCCMLISTCRRDDRMLSRQDLDVTKKIKRRRALASAPGKTPVRGGGVAILVSLGCSSTPRKSRLGSVPPWQERESPLLGVFVCCNWPFPWLASLGVSLGVSLGYPTTSNTPTSALSLEPTGNREGHEVQLSTVKRLPQESL